MVLEKIRRQVTRKVGFFEKPRITRMARIVSDGEQQKAEEKRR
jgi:hypothetical protein